MADLFCGAGGSSSGMFRAVAEMGRDVELVAVNHWSTAIDTHTRNHPGARHFCVNLDSARPENIVPGGRLDLLMASPECTHHSRARGGKPTSDQQRTSAWHVNRWASTLDIRCILVENVAEFREWGPVLPSGSPDPSKKGAYFQAWVQSLWAMGYTVDWKLLNAADYGDATTRTRFFLIARKDGQPVRWPEPTHSATGSADMFGQLKRWRSAAEIIDWSNPGTSLFERKRPLSVKTRLRIARGLQKFGGALAPLYIRLLDLPAEDESTIIAACESGPVSPFVAANRNNNVPRSVDQPVPVVTTSTGGGLFVVEPGAFVLGQQSGAVARETTEPVPTIATDGAISLIRPMVVRYNANCTVEAIDAPLSTVTAGGGHHGLVSPIVVPYYGNSAGSDVNRPLPTVTTKDRFGLCSPTIVSVYGAAQPKGVDEPVGTLTGKGRFALVQPFIVPHFGERDGQQPRVHDIGAPLPAVTSHGAGALVAPVVGPVDVDVDPRRLVLVDGALMLLDIRFRMLSNVELARAMGFNDGELEYEFAGGKTEITKQIGNAVAVNTAAALVRSILGAGFTVDEKPQPIEAAA